MGRQDLEGPAEGIGGRALPAVAVRAAMVRLGPTVWPVPIDCPVPAFSAIGPDCRTVRGLHLVPGVERRARAVGCARPGSEHMRVATDQLLVEAVADVVYVEAAAVLLDLCVEEDLLEHIPELLPQMLGGAFLDGLDGLVGLPDHVLGDGVVRLRLVPGTAVALAETPDGAHETVELGMGPRCVGTLTRLRVHLVYECREGRRAPMPITRAHISIPPHNEADSLRDKDCRRYFEKPS